MSERTENYIKELEAKIASYEKAFSVGDEEIQVNDSDYLRQVILQNKRKKEELIESYCEKARKLMHGLVFTDQSTEEGRVHWSILKAKQNLVETVISDLRSL